MPPDPEQHPAANLLRRHAARRREETGEPPALHPATRAMLQAEVRRTYGASEKPAARRRPGWLRWALAGPAFALLLAGFFVALHVRQESAPRMLPERSTVAQPAAVAQADGAALGISGSASGTPAWAPAELARASKPGAPEPPAAPRAEPVPQPVVTAGVSNALPLDRAQGVVADAESSATHVGAPPAPGEPLGASPAFGDGTFAFAERADAPALPHAALHEFADAASLRAAEESALPAPVVPPVTAGSDTPARLSLAAAAKDMEAGLESAPSPAPLTYASQAPQQFLFFARDKQKAAEAAGEPTGATPGVGLAGAKGATARGGADAPAPAAAPQQQQFRFDTTRFRQLTTRRAARAAEPQLLNRFVLTRTGDEIVVRDEDGAVYRGKVSGDPPDMRADQRDEAGGVPFRLTGRNLRLQRDIVIEGSLLEAQSDKQVADRLKRVIDAGAVFRGTVRVGSGAPFPIEAQEEMR